MILIQFSPISYSEPYYNILGRQKCIHIKEHALNNKRYETTIIEKKCIDFFKISMIRLIFIEKRSILSKIEVSMKASIVVLYSITKF